jgi:hypothetical protein
MNVFIPNIASAFLFACTLSIRRQAVLKPFTVIAITTLLLIGCASTQRKSQLETKDGKQKFPGLTSPEVRAIWVPDKIENDQFVSGHYIYVIQKPATFKQE